jgi:hypothetical protein
MLSTLLLPNLKNIRKSSGIWLSNFSISVQNAGIRKDSAALN